MNAEPEPEPLNRKNITGTITGTPINFDEIFPEDKIIEETSHGIAEPDDDTINPIVDVIDCGLDFAEDTLQEMGYPPLMRKVWDGKGKEALSKAINAYCPQGESLGRTLDTPLVALLLGFGALLLCFLPVIQKFMKERETQEPQYEAIEERQPEELTGEMTGRYEEPHPLQPTSTAPISEKMLTATERLEQLG